MSRGALPQRPSVFSAPSAATWVKLKRMGQHRNRFASLAAAVAAICAACGSAQPRPVISPLGTTSPLPTVTPVPLPTADRTAAVAPTQAPTAGPSPMPNTAATSASVFATITALAATPTYPPTSTPRPQRTPIGAGPADGDIPPTALYVSGGIAVQMISQRVIPGSAATLTIRAQPGAVCALRRDRSAGAAAQTEAIPGVAAQVVGRDGVAAWVWTVDAAEPAGIMRLIVDCGAAGSARLQMTVSH